MSILFPVLVIILGSAFTFVGMFIARLLDKNPKLKELANTAVKSAQDRFKSEEGQARKRAALETLARLANKAGIKIDAEYVEDLVGEAYINMKNQAAANETLQVLPAEPCLPEKEEENPALVAGPEHM